MRRKHVRRHCLVEFMPVNEVEMFSSVPEKRFYVRTIREARARSSRLVGLNHLD